MSDLSPELLVYGFISYVVFLFSTTCHEASHALVAKLGGDTTAARLIRTRIARSRAAGYTPLNPLTPRFASTRV